MTVVILAGGQSIRMGRDKLALSVAGETMLQRALRRYEAVFPRVLVSVAGPEKFPELGEKRVFDRFPGAGPLAGLHAGLMAAGEDVFLTGGDMPFSSPEKALLLASLCGEAEACVLTDPDGRWEPLFGFYRVSVLPKAEARRTARSWVLKISGRLRQMRSARLPRAGFSSFGMSK